MPTINIPPRVRFALYLIGAVSLLTVSYAVDKTWAGDAEVRFVTGLAALLNLLAAAKVDLGGGEKYAALIAQSTAESQRAREAAESVETKLAISSRQVGGAINDAVTAGQDAAQRKRT